MSVPPCTWVEEGRDQLREVWLCDGFTTSVQLRPVGVRHFWTLRCDSGWVASGSCQYDPGAHFRCLAGWRHGRVRRRQMRVVPVRASGPQPAHSQGNETAMPEQGIVKASADFTDVINRVSWMSSHHPIHTQPVWRRAPSVREFFDKRETILAGKRGTNKGSCCSFLRAGTPSASPGHPDLHAQQCLQGDVLPAPSSCPDDRNRGSGFPRHGTTPERPGVMPVCMPRCSPPQYEKMT